MSGPYLNFGCPLPEKSAGKIAPSKQNGANEGALFNWECCPIPFSEEGLELAHFFFDILETNILPRSGGWASQTPYFMHMWKIFKIAKSAAESERNEIRNL